MKRRTDFTELLQDLLMHAEVIDLQLWRKYYIFGQKDRRSRVSSVDFPYWLDV